MARRDLWLLPLLFLLLTGGTVAAPAPVELLRQARAAHQKGDLNAVLAITQQAMQRFGDSDDQSVWVLRCMRATTLVGKGQSNDALAVLQRPLPGALRGTEIEVRCLAAQAYASQNNPKDALALITRAYGLAKEKHPARLAEVLVIRMILDPPNAAKYGAEGLRSLKKYPDPESETRIRGQIGKGLADRGRFDEAVAIWKPGLEKARGLRNFLLIEKFEGNLGWAYMELGDYESAGELFRTAQKTALDVGQRIDAVPWTYQLGNVRLHEGNPEAAEKEYKLAYDEAVATSHKQLPMVLWSMARFELQRGRLADAQRYAEQAGANARKSDDTENELRAVLIEARVAMARKDFETGERLLKRIIETTTQQWMKSEAFGRLAQIYEGRNDFTAADEQFAQALKVARGARKDIDDVELRLSFFNTVEELYDNYVDFLMARGNTTKALDVAESSRAQTLEESLDDVTPPRDVRVLARESGATILCYWLGAAHSYLWVITPNRVDSAPLPAKQIVESALDAYQRNLLDQRGTLDRSSARGIALWKMLIEPASRSIAPGSRVIVVPHGLLNAFNVETLVAPSPKPHWWIDDVIVMTASSLGLLTHAKSDQQPSRKLLLVGNAPPPDKSFVPLRNASEELRNVARHFDRAQSLVLSGPQATPSAYRAASPEGFAYLHFVAHGVAVRFQPMESAVILAREGDGETYKLYARDIAKQPLNARLVTISSCHGAGTRRYAGEGLVGLGWAFLRAGADNVVAALWEVNDAETPKLMDTFYAGLAKGDDPATALRDAKLALKAEGGVAARPRYWAPFLLYGRS